MKFWLGVHKARWAWSLDVPLFLSARQMRVPAKLSRATAEYAVDGGGFTELWTHGRWTLTAKWYVDELNRWRDGAGPMTWCAIQDWMCEEIRLFGIGCWNPVSDNPRKIRNSV